ncbi:MAG: glycosyltransferase family 4 protein [Pseudomonadota bacterium]
MPTPVIAVIGNLPPPAGGAEVFARELILALAKRGVAVHVLTQSHSKLAIQGSGESLFYPYDENAQSELSAAGVIIHSCLNELKDLEGVDQRGRYLAGLFRELRVELIHCHMSTGFLKEAISAAELAAIPIVSTLHGMTHLLPKYDSFTGPGWSPAIIASLMARASHNVVVSRPMLEYCERRGMKNVSLISSAVDCDRYSVDGLHTRQGILYVGKLNRYKGLQQTLSGFLRIAHQFDDALYLVGRGITLHFFEQTGFFLTASQQQRLRELIQNRRVILVGELDPQALQLHYRQRRVLALPSLTEGLPITILEALASGMPVVASSVGSIPDVVQDGVNGFLVPPGNITSFSQRLSEALTRDDPALAERCRASVALYDIEPITTAYLQLFRGLIENAPGRSSPGI